MASAGETTGRPPDEEEIPLCTPSNCPPDEDQYKLKCNNCQRLVHYKCTELPLYQLNQFLTRGYRNFICVNCVPEHLHDIVPDNQASTSCLTNIITDLMTKLQKISTENDCYKVKNLELTENNQKLCNDIQKYEEGFQKRLKEIDELQVKNAEYDDSITSHEENEMKLKRLINRQENELKEQEQKGNPDFDNIVQLEACMKKELHLIGKGIKESLLHEVQENNKQMEEKLNKVLNQRVTYADSVRSEESGVNQSNPTEITDFRTIIKEARNEELAEQTEKRRRACNIILHGVNEAVDADRNEAKKHAETFINSFIDTIKVTTTFKSVLRLGKASPSKNRPIMVLFEKEEEKDRIMNSLKHLKDNEIYKGLSVNRGFDLN